MLKDYVKIYFDGGSRGNPGPAAGAAFADYEGGKERACFLPSATNNEAEYRGLLMAIELAIELKLSHIEFLGDSKLVVMQVRNEWQAKHSMMQELKLQVLRKLAALPHWRIGWIPRAQNSEADRIANQEMDKRLGIMPLAKLEPVALSPQAQAKAEALPLIPAAAAIAALNQLGPQAGFKDFRHLKVGGSDAYSRLSMESLAETLPRFSELREAFLESLNSEALTRDLDHDAKLKLLLQALRWSARGLQSDLPLRKVLVDLEMAKNMRAKR